MAAAGLFAAEPRVELIDGEIIDMPPIGSRHAAALTRLARILAAATEQHTALRQQLPIRLGEHSEPQPDIALVRPRADDYESGHPTADDVLLLVEISDSTLRYDVDIKAPFYARHGVGELWMVDLGGGQIRRYADPKEGRYTRRRSSTPGVTSIVALPGLSVDLSPLVLKTAPP